MNDSDEVISFRDDWFDSGKMFNAPASKIERGGCAIYTVSNKDGSICCGVSGELYFGNSTNMWCIAFSNPWTGCLKCKVSMVGSEKTIDKGSFWNHMPDKVVHSSGGGY